MKSRKIAGKCCFKPKQLFLASQSEFSRADSPGCFLCFFLASLRSTFVFDLCIADKLVPPMAAVSGNLVLRLEHLDLCQMNDSDEFSVR